MSIKKDILWRFAAVYVSMLIMAVLILIRIVTIQFLQKEKWEEKASHISLKDIRIPSNRGDILADDGKRLLASSVPSYEIRMDLRSDGLTDDLFYGKIDSLALCLSGLFNDKTPQAYKRELVNARKKGERFYLIERNVNHLELQKLMSFPIYREGRFTGGFIYLQENKRIKPHYSLASRTIGYLSEPGNIVGLEGAYDQELAGTEGIRLMQRLSGGVWMPVGNNNEVEPKDGYDVVTTININLQDVAESALRRQLMLHNAHHGTAIMMEVKTGHVKAIVNLQKDSDDQYRELYNYAIGESSEPGSTFKLPVIMALLEDSHVDLDDTIDTKNGVYQLYDKKIRDSNWDKGGYGKITVREAIEYSSNVAMAKMVTEHYGNNEADFVNRLYRMNLNEKLGVEIKGEGNPYIKYPKSKYWSGISLAMMSHGYEVRITPLQLLTFYNAIANNGKMVKPVFAKELRMHGETVEKYGTEVITPSISSRPTLKKAQTMLKGVVAHGSANNLNDTHIKIAGKTGTAQVNYANSDKEMSYQASFVGYFPADDPKYSCMVVINSPSKSVYYGNLVAGPVFLEIAKKAYATNFNLQQALKEKPEEPEIPFSKSGIRGETVNALKGLNIEVNDNTSSNWVSTFKMDHKVELKTRETVENLVPNVVEMGLKDALYLLESAGLKVHVNGRGSVRAQSILPGTRVKEGQVITLEMSFTG
ncbi:MAG: PASTA domain-containing protein [Bacteroidetes bacterium]|jgi:cell division protein FtsI (penicillin-binding protein 3)|nr:PASTA domain-containing protein [Bacteroidota bacterium]